MSRHKLVKNLDLDDELDDYDGGGFDDADVEGTAGFLAQSEILSPHTNRYDLELSEEDQGQLFDEEVFPFMLKHVAEHMRIGTVKVRLALPPDASSITDGQIQEALWHYYYDVDKSVSYLLNKHMPKTKTAKKDTEKRTGGLGFSNLTI